MTWIVTELRQRSPGPERQVPFLVGDHWGFHYNSSDEPVLPIIGDGRDMGNGTVYCFAEADKELVKRAFATAVRVMNLDGANVPPVVREDGEDSEPEEDDAPPFALHIWGRAEGVPFSRNTWNDMKAVKLMPLSFEC